MVTKENVTFLRKVYSISNAAPTSILTQLGAARYVASKLLDEEKKACLARLDPFFGLSDETVIIIDLDGIRLA
jgi:hypothetical protein